MTGSRDGLTIVLLIAVSTLLALSVMYGLDGENGNRATGEREIQVPPPPLTDGIFPCTECHADMEVNRQRRELEFHEDIELQHDEKNRWCLDCHDADDRDRLHLADGEPVSFEKSYRLCGQCHGPKYRDWRNGIHGRRTGMWNGTRQYLLCAHCHDPHAPRFKAMTPEPPPVPPGELKRER